MQRSELWDKRRLVSQFNEKALLPVGLSDGLPPHAGFEADIRERLIDAFVARGFDRITPPLVEFEDHLLAGTGAAMAEQTFRLMDPVSQRMMGVRADITPQVARVATTRLAHLPRPLRLCYAGDVLRIRGTQLRPERQFVQVGAELIGVDTPETDAEMIVMAAAALRKLGLPEIIVDIGQPMLVPALCSQLGLDEHQASALRLALDRKDAAGVDAFSSELGDKAVDLLRPLVEASGPVDRVTAQLASLELSGDAATARDTLLAVVEQVKSRAPDLELTVDAVENRGFEYHSGVTFTLFAPNVRGELGSGGRYIAGQGEGAEVEPATGFSLFMDSVLRGLTPPAAQPRVYVPSGTIEQVIEDLHADGFRTIIGTSVNDTEVEASRLGCSHLLVDGTPRPITAS